MGKHFSTSIGSDLTRGAMAAELLDAETEASLARRWRDDGDEQALHRLVTAYMRLAISMAGKYRRYGAPMNDLIQEAGVGLMKAASKFDPERGVRVFRDVLRRMVSMPGRLMDDGRSAGLFDQFAAVAQRAQVYTVTDYADIIRHLVETWKVPTRALSGKAAVAQTFLCRQAERLESFAERLSEEVAQQAPKPFSWIHGRTA